VAVTITSDGYIKRQPLSAYRQQRRGGMGVMGAETKSEDFVTDLFIATTHEYILFFTDMGKAHWLRVFDVPSFGRTARGKSIVNLLSLEADEKITEAIPVKSFDSEGFIVMATSLGQVVKTPIRAYSNPRKGGIKAVNLRGDRLVAARLTGGDQDLILATAGGKAIRFRGGRPPQQPGVHGGPGDHPGGRRRGDLYGRGPAGSLPPHRDQAGVR